MTEAIRPYSSSTEEPCPPFHKLCGKGTTDDNLCVSQDHRCPINDIRFVFPGDKAPQGYEAVPLNSGVQIAFTSDSSSLPISNVRLTESDVCMNKDEFGVSQGRTPYPLYEETTCDYSIANKHTDPRLVSIGKIREDILFHENGLEDEFEQLPQLEISDGAKY